jgi:hypothetical protein
VTEGPVREFTAQLDRDGDVFDVVVKYTVYGGDFDTWRNHIIDPEVEYKTATRIHDDAEIELTEEEELSIEAAIFKSWEDEKD